MEDGADAEGRSERVEGRNDPTGRTGDDRRSTGDEPAAGGLAGSLRLAFREHRAYFLASVVLFAVGVAGGVAMAATGYDLFGAMGLDSAEDLFPEDVTMLTILANNTVVYFVSILGALTFGVLPFASLLFNGLLVGYVGSLVADQVGLAFLVVGLAPHGVLELPAIFASAAVSFRVVHRVIDRMLGRRDAVMTRPEWRRTALFVVFFWAVLAFAAVVEFYVTGALLDALFGTGSRPSI